MVGTAITAAASIGGALISSSASKSAGQTQAAAAGDASQAQLAMFNTIRSDLAPFVNLGTGAVPQLQTLTGTGAGGNPLTAPLTRQFQPTMAELAATPGYQFVRDQGLKSVQNGYAASGLGSSGAALKGAADYAEGLAGTTYQNQLNNFLAQNQQTYNMLSGIVQGGQNAAVQTGNFGTQSTALSNQALLGGASATAAGTIGSANAISGGLNNLGALAFLTNFNSGGGGGGGVPITNNNYLNPNY